MYKYTQILVYKSIQTHRLVHRHKKFFYTLLNGHM